MAPPYYERAGGVTGGIIREVKSPHSGCTYFVSLAPEPTVDAWSIGILPTRSEKLLFGLTSVANAAFPAVFILLRDTPAEGKWMLDILTRLVIEVPEDDWLVRVEEHLPAEVALFRPRAADRLRELGFNPR